MLRVAYGLLLLLFATVSSMALQSPPPKTRITSSRLSGWLAEAEKKHGRVAMTALPALAKIAAATGQDPVPWLNQQPAMDQLFFYATAGVLESVNLRRFGPGFSLKDGETPGKFLRSADDPPPLLSAVEDAAGRAAMLLALGVFLRSLLLST